MRKNYIDYENYEALKSKYGHVSTWALWDEDILDGSKDNVDMDYKKRKELLIANSEEEYKEKGLDKLLHGDVVVLALNFSCPKETKSNPNPLLKILNEYKDEAYNNKRYEELMNLVENDERFMFYNMYKAAARRYAPEFMKSDILHGAYMTDFIKFVEDDGKLLPAGIPDSNSGADIIADSLSKDKIYIQAKGLKEEFDLLGIKPKVIITVSSKLNRTSVREAIEKELGYKPYFEQLHHYSPNGSSYRNRGFESYDDMYASEIRQIAESIKSKV
ncbi:hypothetical protein GCM10028778_18970 [Barrientosiimonas marina]|uniref:Uncharacterized protein n=1 Tax=Lentibacillus kimchii TaxID=1542911 RepID=A0ABW2UYA6_9BACI